MFVVPVTSFLTGLMSSTRRRGKLCYFGREKTSHYDQKASINGVEKEKTSHHKPRVLRWPRMKPEEGRKSMSNFLDAEKSFNLALRVHTIGNQPKFIFC